MRDEVFVAMPFASRFEPRWKRIFQPAIEGEPLGGRVLKAVRVDVRKSGDSILSEIISGISHAQLVLADLSVTDRWGLWRRRFARNGNVMYEVGVALACRQPVEVVLCRDDRDALLFDVTSIPVVSFDPANVAASVRLIRMALNDRLAERELTKDLRAQNILDGLSQFEINVARANGHLQHLAWEGPSLPAAVAMALPDLLRKQILRLEPELKCGEAAVYTWTPLGQAVLKRLLGPPTSA